MSHSPRRRACQILIAVLLLSLAPRARASAYDGHPKLVILLVIDQFRGDYMDRYRSDFKGDGFRLFLDRGSYFENCYYDYANTETSPGHATLATGAYTDGHGISANAWWDLSRNKTRPITSVEDGRFQIVGLPAGSKPSGGASPINLRASTIGDSLRLATQGQSKVFGVSLKDRAAILLAGYTANGAYWIDHASGAFITSSYYMDALPDWAAAFDSSGRIAQAEQEAGVTAPSNFYQTVGKTPAANAYELDFARALITGEQLGQHPVTDLLALSLSANDLAGHSYGPDSPEEQQMVDTLDQQLDGFFTWLDKAVPGGLDNVWIAFSADHGVAPAPAQALQLGLPAAQIDLKKLAASINGSINERFSPGETIQYLLPRASLPYLFLNQPSFEGAGVNEQEAEQAVLKAVPDAIAGLKPAVAPPPQGATSVNGPAPSSQPAQAVAGSAAPSAQAAARNPGTAAATEPSASTPTVPTLGAAKPALSQPSAPQASSAGMLAPPVSSAPTTGATLSPATPSSSSAPPAAATPPPVKRLPPIPLIVHAYTREQLESGALPPTKWGRLLAHSYSPNGGWYVMVIPAAFQMQTIASGTTHFSPWSYDRHAPLGFFGAPFVPGIYLNRVQPVDLAATLAALLGVNQPSASIGNILTEAIRKNPEVPVSRPARRPRAAQRAPSASAKRDIPRAEPPPAKKPANP